MKGTGGVREAGGGENSIARKGSKDSTGVSGSEKGWGGIHSMIQQVGGSPSWTESRRRPSGERVARRERKSRGADGVLRMSIY